MIKLLPPTAVSRQTNHTNYAVLRGFFLFFDFLQLFVGRLVFDLLVRCFFFLSLSAFYITFIISDGVDGPLIAIKQTSAAQLRFFSFYFCICCANSAHAILRRRQRGNANNITY